MRAATRTSDDARRDLADQSEPVGRPPPRARGRRLPALAALLAAVAVEPAVSGPPQSLAGVRLEQRLGESVPREARFVDETAAEVTLSDYGGERPVILVPVFYRCPMLCTQVLNALIRATERLDFRAGERFDVVVFSIDPREGPDLASQKKLSYFRRRMSDASHRGWHFLTGAESEIHELTRAIGFHYTYDPATDQFAHPAAIAVLTPTGRVSRYLTGVDYDTGDLRLALLEASQGSIGSVADRIILRCYRYDPSTGRYGFAVMSAVRAGGAMTVIALAAAVLLLNRRRRAPALREAERRA